ncbi:MAG: 8-amino-7-oxononanoate synthase [Desulfurivibrio sp.]|nr:8-amino-7-oxononanoate synthase [Desulfurivibrio sp.]
MKDLTEALSKWGEEGTLRQLLPLEHGEEGGRVRLPMAGEAGKTPQWREMLDFSSNDYLGLSRHPQLLTAAAEAMGRWGTGAGAARLLSGNLEIHRQLEEALALLTGREAALLFGSGYLANIGVIPALLGRHDTVFCDRHSHASIYDGCRLAGAKLHRFRHNDCNHLEELLRRHRGHNEALIIVESLYSMDGDIAPLPELITLKERYQCRLLVDEAHAIGVFGEHGGGLCAAAGVAERVDLLLGTLGKALGSYGAFVAGERTTIAYLLNRARSFIFATAPPPATTAAGLAAVKLLAAEPQLLQELEQKVEFFKNHLRELEIGTELGPSQIIPLPVGKSDAALQLAATLRDKGIFTVAIRPPTVPAGTARLRLSITRHLDENDLAEAAMLLAKAWPAASGDTGQAEPVASESLADSNAWRQVKIKGQSGK